MPRVVTQDTALYYEEAGKGDPVILIQGLGGDLQGWANQVPVLSQHYRVIAMDNRGAGRSNAPDKPYSIETMARDVRNLMDQIDVEQAHLVGFSMGGCIAQQLAIESPKRIKKLVLINSTPALDAFGREVLKVWMAVRQSSMSREEWARFAAVWTHSGALIADERRYRAAIANSLSNPYAQQDHAFLRQADALLQFDARDDLKSLEVQALVLASEENILVPRAQSEELAELIPNATYQELPGGHIGPMEHPDEYNAAILAFLRGETE